MTVYQHVGLDESYLAICCPGWACTLCRAAAAIFSRRLVSVRVDRLQQALSSIWCLAKGNHCRSSVPQPLLLPALCPIFDLQLGLGPEPVQVQAQSAVGGHRCNYVAVALIVWVEQSRSNPRVWPKYTLLAYEQMDFGPIRLSGVVLFTLSRCNQAEKDLQICSILFRLSCAKFRQLETVLASQVRMGIPNVYVSHYRGSTTRAGAAPKANAI